MRVLLFPITHKTLSDELIALLILPPSVLPRRAIRRSLNPPSSGVSRCLAGGTSLRRHTRGTQIQSSFTYRSVATYPEETLDCYPLCHWTVTERRLHTRQTLEVHTHCTTVRRRLNHGQCPLPLRSGEVPLTYIPLP